MAEFCLDCWNKINDTNYDESEFIVSEGLEFCEECEELKRIVVVARSAYCRRDIEQLMMAFAIVPKIIIASTKLLLTHIKKLIERNKKCNRRK